MYDGSRRDRTSWLLAALLALATLATYSGVLTNNFVEFDDPAYITANYLNSGDRTRAAKAFEELLRIDPDNSQGKSMLQISRQP